MKTEQKIWSFFALIFFLLAMAAVSMHAFWFISTAAAPLLLTGIISVLRNLNPFPAVMIVPHYTSALNGIGPIVSPLILELLKEENLNIPPVPAFLSVSATAVGFFCSLMIVRMRPVSTDLGILYGLGYISISLGLQEFDLGWPTLATFGVSSVMVLLRVHLEKTLPAPGIHAAGRVW